MREWYYGNTELQEGITKRDIKPEGTPNGTREYIYLPLSKEQQEHLDLDPKRHYGFCVIRQNWL